MVKTLFYGFLAAGLLQFGLLLPAQDKTDKNDLLATEAAKQFIEA
jgi:hypothetical protein